MIGQIGFVNHFWGFSPQYLTFLQLQWGPQKSEHPTQKVCKLAKRDFPNRLFERF